MNRKKLKRQIVDASDGILSEEQIKNLEKELQHYPQLYEDYREIMALPDIFEIYPAVPDHRIHQASIRRIKRAIQKRSVDRDSFEMISLNWFKRYALAASLAIFAITSVFSWIQSQNGNNNYEIAAEEYFYPEVETTSGSYILYLEEIAEE